jgi:hypothetical protein
VGKASSDIIITSTTNKEMSVQSETDYVNGLIHQRLVHEIHTSERKSFRGCRRRWNWIFQEYYYPQVTAKPLEFGVAFHNAMEVLYTPETWKMDRQIVLNAAIQAFVDTCDKQLKKYSENYEPTSEVLEDYNERVELGKGMLKYYASQVAPKYDQGWRPIRVEVEFMVPIQNPGTDEYLYCKCKRCQKTWKEVYPQLGLEEGNGGLWEVEYDPQEGPVGLGLWQGLPVVLAGRLDMLAEDNYGDYWIVDWKTAARLARGDVSGQDRDEFLDLDDQIGSYVMALRRKLGLRVRGFVYVELKKAFPVAPERNKTIRLGRMYSVNKNQAVDYETYRDCVAENDQQAYEAGLYDDFLKWLQEEGQNFYGRYQIPKTDEELEELERELFLEAQDMVDPNLRIYRNSGRFNCGFCAFRQPCLEKTRQGDYLYMLETLYDKREKHYWAERLSTDSQGGE